MGVYGYWFAQFAIGRPVQVRAVGSMTDSGVDDQVVVALAGAGHRHASVTTSMSVTNSGLAAIHGTAGSVDHFDHDDAWRIGSALVAHCRAEP